MSDTSAPRARPPVASSASTRRAAQALRALSVRPPSATTASSPGAWSQLQALGRLLGARRKGGPHSNQKQQHKQQQAWGVNSPTHYGTSTNSLYSPRLWTPPLLAAWTPFSLCWSSLIWTRLRQDPASGHLLAATLGHSTLLLAALMAAALQHEGFEAGPPQETGASGASMAEGTGTPGEQAAGMGLGFHLAVSGGGAMRRPASSLRLVSVPEAADSPATPTAAGFDVSPAHSTAHGDAASARLPLGRLPHKDCDGSGASRALAAALLQMAGMAVTPPPCPSPSAPSLPSTSCTVAKGGSEAVPEPGRQGEAEGRAGRQGRLLMLLPSDEEFFAALTALTLAPPGALDPSAAPQAEAGSWAGAHWGRGGSRGAVTASGVWTSMAQSTAGSVLGSEWPEGSEAFHDFEGEGGEDGGREGRDQEDREAGTPRSMGEERDVKRTGRRTGEQQGGQGVPGEAGADGTGHATLLASAEQAASPGLVISGVSPVRILAPALEPTCSPRSTPGPQPFSPGAPIASCTPPLPPATPLAPPPPGPLPPPTLLQRLLPLCLPLAMLLPPWVVHSTAVCTVRRLCFPSTPHLPRRTIPGRRRMDSQGVGRTVDRLLSGFPGFARQLAEEVQVPPQGVAAESQLCATLLDEGGVEGSPAEGVGVHTPQLPHPSSALALKPLSARLGAKRWLAAIAPGGPRELAAVIGELRRRVAGARDDEVRGVAAAVAAAAAAKVVGDAEAEHRRQREVEEVEQRRRDEGKAAAGRLAEAERQLKELRGRLEEAGRQLEAQAAEAAVQLAAAKQEAERQALEAGRQLVTTQGDSDARLRSAAQAADRQLTHLREEAERQLATAREEAAWQLAAVQAEAEASREAQAQEAAWKLQVAQGEADRKLAAQVRESEAALSAARVEADRKLAAALAEAARQLAEAQEDAQQRHDSLRDQVDRGLAVTRAEADEQLIEAERKLAAVQADAQQKLAAAQVEAGEKLAALEAEAGRRVASLLSDLEGLRSALAALASTAGGCLAAVETAVGAAEGAAAAVGEAERGVLEARAVGAHREREEEARAWQEKVEETERVGREAEAAARVREGVLTGQLEEAARMAAQQEAAVAAAVGGLTAAVVAAEKALAATDGLASCREGLQSHKCELLEAQASAWRAKAEGAEQARGEAEDAAREREGAMAEQLEVTARGVAEREQAVAAAVRGLSAAVAAAESALEAATVPAAEREAVWQQKCELLERQVWEWQGRVGEAEAAGREREEGARNEVEGVARERELHLTRKLDAAAHKAVEREAAVAAAAAGLSAAVVAAESAHAAANGPTAEREAVWQQKCELLERQAWEWRGKAGEAEAAGRSREEGARKEVEGVARERELDLTRKLDAATHKAAEREAAVVAAAAGLSAAVVAAEKALLSADTFSTDKESVWQRKCELLEDEVQVWQGRVAAADAAGREREEGARREVEGVARHREGALVGQLEEAARKAAARETAVAAAAKGLTAAMVAAEKALAATDGVAAGREVVLQQKCILAEVQASTLSQQLVQLQLSSAALQQREGELRGHCAALEQQCRRLLGGYTAVTAELAGAAAEARGAWDGAQAVMRAAEVASGAEAEGQLAAAFEQTEQLRAELGHAVAAAGSAEEALVGAVVSGAIGKAVLEAQVSDLQHHLADLTGAFEAMLMGPQLLPLPPHQRTAQESGGKADGLDSRHHDLAAEWSVSDDTPDVTQPPQPTERLPPQLAYLLGEDELGSLLNTLIEQVTIMQVHARALQLDLAPTGEGDAAEAANRTNGEDASGGQAGVDGVDAAGQPAAVEGLRQLQPGGATGEGAGEEGGSAGGTPGRPQPESSLGLSTPSPLRGGLSPTPVGGRGDEGGRWGEATGLGASVGLHTPDGSSAFPLPGDSSHPTPPHLAHTPGSHQAAHGPGAAAGAAVTSLRRGGSQGVGRYSVASVYSVGSRYSMGQYSPGMNATPAGQYHWPNMCELLELASGAAGLMRGAMGEEAGAEGGMRNGEAGGAAPKRTLVFGEGDGDEGRAGAAQGGPFGTLPLPGLPPGVAAAPLASWDASANPNPGPGPARLSGGGPGPRVNPRGADGGSPLPPLSGWVLPPPPLVQALMRRSAASYRASLAAASRSASLSHFPTQPHTTPHRQTSPPSAVNATVGPPFTMALDALPTSTIPSTHLVGSQSLAPLPTSSATANGAGVGGGGSVDGFGALLRAYLAAEGALTGQGQGRGAPAPQPPVPEAHLPAQLQAQLQATPPRPQPDPRLHPQLQATAAAGLWPRAQPRLQQIQLHLDAALGALLEAERKLLTSPPPRNTNPSYGAWAGVGGAAVVAAVSGFAAASQEGGAWGDGGAGPAAGVTPSRLASLRGAVDAAELELEARTSMHNPLYMPSDPDAACQVAVVLPSPSRTSSQLLDSSGAVTAALRSPAAAAGSGGGAGGGTGEGGVSAGGAGLGAATTLAVPAPSRMQPSNPGEALPVPRFPRYEVALEPLAPGSETNAATRPPPPTGDGLMEAGERAKASATPGISALPARLVAGMPCPPGMLPCTPYPRCDSLTGWTDAKTAVSDNEGGEAGPAVETGERGGPQMTCDDGQGGEAGEGEGEELASEEGFNAPWPPRFPGSDPALSSTRKAPPQAAPSGHTSTASTPPPHTQPPKPQQVQRPPLQRAASASLGRSSLGSGAALDPSLRSLKDLGSQHQGKGGELKRPVGSAFGSMAGGSGGAGGSTGGGAGAGRGEAGAGTGGGRAVTGGEARSSAGGARAAALGSAAGGQGAGARAEGASGGRAPLLRTTSASLASPRPNPNPSPSPSPRGSNPTPSPKPATPWRPTGVVRGTPAPSASSGTLAGLRRLSSGGLGLGAGVGGSASGFGGLKSLARLNSASLSVGGSSNDGSVASSAATTFRAASIVSSSSFRAPSVAGSSRSSSLATRTSAPLAAGITAATAARLARARSAAGALPATAETAVAAVTAARGATASPAASGGGAAAAAQRAGLGGRGASTGAGAGRVTTRTSAATAAAGRDQTPALGRPALSGTPSSSPSTSPFAAPALNALDQPACDTAPSAPAHTPSTDAHTTSSNASRQPDAAVRSNPAAAHHNPAATTATRAPLGTPSATNPVHNTPGAATPTPTPTHAPTTAEVTAVTAAQTKVGEDEASAAHLGHPAAAQGVLLVTATAVQDRGDGDPDAHALSKGKGGSAAQAAQSSWVGAEHGAAKGVGVVGEAATGLGDDGMGERWGLGRDEGVDEDGFEGDEVVGEGEGGVSREEGSLCLEGMLAVVPEEEGEEHEQGEGEGEGEGEAPLAALGPSSRASHPQHPQHLQQDPRQHLQHQRRSAGGAGPGAEEGAPRSSPTSSPTSSHTLPVSRGHPPPEGHDPSTGRASPSPASSAATLPAVGAAGRLPSTAGTAAMAAGAPAGAGAGAEAPAKARQPRTTSGSGAPEDPDLDGDYRVSAGSRFSCGLLPRLNSLGRRSSASSTGGAKGGPGGDTWSTSFSVAGGAGSRVGSVSALTDTGGAEPAGGMGRAASWFRSRSRRASNVSASGAPAGASGGGSNVNSNAQRGAPDMSEGGGGAAAGAQRSLGEKLWGSLRLGSSREKR